MSDNTSTARFHDHLHESLATLYKMKFFALTSILCAAATTLAAPLTAATSGTATVSYDEEYDNSSASLDAVACSDGTNGLLTKGQYFRPRNVTSDSPATTGYTTFGSLPGFPNIGGAFAVAGWNSANCGTCWKLTYNGKSINVLAVDHAGSGFNINLDAMNELTNGQAVSLGHVTADAQQVDGVECGMQ